MATKTVFYGLTDVLITAGNEYIITCDVRIDASQDMSFVNAIYPTVNNSAIFLSDVVSINSASAVNTIIKISSKFKAPTTQNYNFGLDVFTTTEFNNVLFQLDNFEVKGPLDTLTEKKTIIYDSKCLYKNFQVQFIDSLGGYEYWTFRTYGDRGIQFTESKQIKRNIFANWDTDWINAIAQNDYTSVNSQDTLTLRAENLSEIQVQELFELFGSVRAYDINKDKPRVLLIDKQSVSVTQGEKLYNLTFNVKSTFDNYRQRQ